MQLIKKIILLIPSIPFLLWALFGFTYLSNNGDAAIASGMAAIYSSFVVGVAEIILIILYIKLGGKQSNEIQVKDDQGSATNPQLGFGDMALIFVTCVYLFSYYFAIGHTVIDMILVTVSLCSLLYATYFLKKNKRIGVIISIGINITSTILLLLYVLLQYSEIYGSGVGSGTGVASDSSELTSFISMINIAIFAGFLLDFYCVARLKNYLQLKINS